jgi:hypothetical protein
MNPYDPPDETTETPESDPPPSDPPWRVTLVSYIAIASLAVVVRLAIIGRFLF